MGNHFSKKKKLKVPNDYKLIKMLSYNVRLIFGSPLRANKIGYFISDINYNLENDIICLQGIYDNESKNTIINIFKQNYKNIYIIPEFNLSNNYQNPNKNCDCDGIGTLILSKYEIIDYKCLKFKETLDNITEYTGVLCINVNINNNVVSIYNIQLQSDYKDIISNSKIRENQLKELHIFIKNNINHIENNTYFSKYRKTNINLIIGSLNIPSDNMNNNLLTDEYNNLIKKYNYLDMYKIINNNEKYKYKNRDDYILLYLFDNLDVKNKNLESDQSTIDINDLPKLKNIIDKLNDRKIILNKLYKYYKINFIKTNIINIDYSNHLPLELIIIIKIK